MPIYTNTNFCGHWPVGTAAVVTAESPERAAELLEAELAKNGLPQKVKPTDMWRHESDQETVQILCDGDY